MGKIARLRQPIGNQRSGKEIGVMERSGERGCQLPCRDATEQQLFSLGEGTRIIGIIYRWRGKVLVPRT